MNKDSWQQEDNQAAWGVSVIMAIVVTVVLFRVTRFTPALMILTFLIMTGLIYQVVGFRPKRRLKLFPVSRTEARHVVAAVLAEKGLPYKWRNGRFRLQGSNLRIHLKPYRHRGLQGVIIRIGPDTDDNTLLITRLCEHLDETLSPS